jgi:SSS family solute:Na+ symporter
MSGQAALNPVDYAVFFAYLAATLVLGFAVARHVRGKPKDYFLGDRKMPWYVVGTSMVATDISSEHFIANVGIAYQYGIVAATGSWNSWIIYSILILIFLPYYVRTGLYTMPEFLERRFNATCRYIFAVSLVVGYITAIMAGSLYAGGLALEHIFDLRFADDPRTNIQWGIVFFAVVTGAYTIYGGLKSAAWTDFLQMLLLLVAGILVPVLALWQIGGVSRLVEEMPDKFQVFLPANHREFPFTGVFTGFLTVGLWYSCASQHMVQRVLSAKDEWHARMGVILAGFLHIITPAFFVLPGIAAVKLYPDLEKPDNAYLLLVKSLVPTGFRGLILAGMAAALMSTVSSVLNSTSTLLTMDLYRKVINPNATDRQQVRFGQISGIVALVASVLIAFYFVDSHEALFRLVQRIFFFIAPPFAVVFLMGLLWRRTNGTAAVTTIVAGFAFRLIWEFLLLPYIPALREYRAAYRNGALINWVFCMITIVVVSQLTKPPPLEKTRGIIWNPRYAELPEEERRRYRGWKDYRLWWFLFVAITLAIYGFFLWYRFQYPVNMWHG